MAVRSTGKFNKLQGINREVKGWWQNGWLFRERQPAINVIITIAYVINSLVARTIHLLFTTTCHSISHRIDQPDHILGMDVADSADAKRIAVRYLPRINDKPPCFQVTVKPIETPSGVCGAQESRNDGRLQFRR